MAISERIVVLTGAGISAESGIRTFRDAGGLWEHHRLEDVATPDAFRRNPGLVQEFYNQRRRQLDEVNIKPNAAHHALVRLEKVFSDNFLLITQNVDDLHERAGSQRVIHMHGELRKARCIHCHVVSMAKDDLNDASICPDCGSTGKLRPHIVWFGEEPLEMPYIQKALARCSIFAAIGTSSSVYPAAGFIELARCASARTVELNLEPSDRHHVFDAHYYGPASERVPEWVDKILRNTSY